MGSNSDCVPVLNRPPKINFSTRQAMRSCPDAVPSADKTPPAEGAHDLKILLFFGYIFVFARIPAKDGDDCPSQVRQSFSQHGRYTVDSLLGGLQYVCSFFAL